MEARKMRGNASYLAFTATPKNSTLERFGVKQEDGSFRPFHLYSMKQAIEEGFILDFFNNTDSIKEAFDPFYTSTKLSEATDINILHGLKDALDSVAVYEWCEVEDFVAKYFLDVDAQELSPIIDTAADRFNHELEEIIKAFNERWFNGWEATPEDQRVKFITLSKQVRTHPDFAKKVARNTNTNTPTRDLALKKILEDVMSQQRRLELELYKLYAKDDAFKAAFFDTMKRMVDEPELAR